MSGPPPDGLAPGRPRSARRFVLLGLTLVLVLLALVPWLLSDRISERVRRALEQRLATAIGGEARIGALTLELRRLEVRFRDVRLRWPESEAGSLEVRVASGRARLALSGLAGLGSGRIHLLDVELDGPEVDARGSAWESGEPTDSLLDLRLDRLEVRNGRMRLDDVEARAGFEAQQLFVHAARDADGLAGDARMRLELHRAPGWPALPLDLQTRFRLHRNDIELQGLVAHGSGVDLRLAATVAFIDALAMTGRGRGSIDLRELAPWLDPGTPCAAGVLAGPFSFEVGPGPLHVRSLVEATGLSCAGLELAGRALAHYAPGRIELVDVQAQTLGGRVQGQAEVTLALESSFEGRLEAEEIRSPDLLRWIGVPLPLHGRLQGRITLAGLLEQRSSWHGQGTFTARPDPGVGGLRIEHPARLELQGESLQLLASGVELDAARLDVQVRVELGESPRRGTVTLEGSTTDAERTQQATLRLLEGLGLELPESLRQLLQGRGRIAAHLALGPETDWDLALDLADGAWGARPFRTAQVELRSTAGGLSISRMNVESEDGALQVAGALALEPFSVRELDLALQDFDVRWLLQLAGVELDLQGRLQADLKVAPSAAGPVGDGSFRLTNGQWLGESIDVLAGRIAIRPGEITLLDVSAEGPAGSVSGGGSWTPATGQGSAEVRAGQLWLGRLAALRGTPLALDGQSEITGSFRFAGGQPQGRLSAEGTDWSLGGYPLGRLSAVFDFGPQGLEARLASLDAMGWTVEGGLSWTEPLPYHATVELDGTPVDLQLGLLEDAWARLQAHVEIAGALRGPTAPRVEARLDHAEIHLGVQRLETSAPVHVRLSNEKFSAAAIRLVGDGVDLEGQLSGDLAREEFQASVRGHLDLSLVSAVQPEVRAAGRAELVLSAGGSFAEPSLSGSLRGQGGRLRWLGFSQGLEQLEFALALEGQQVQLETLRARFGTGEVHAVGQGELEGLALASYRVTIDGANVRLSYPEGFRGTYDGELVLTGGPAGASVGGRVQMLRGLYDQPFDLTRVLGFGTREYSVEDESALPDLDLDLVVVADGNVWVDNDTARVESSFDVHVGGTLARPEITGRLWMVEGGRVVFRDVQYTITSGSLDFVDLTQVNPYLTLRATATVEEYTILLRIEGTLDKFEYELTSEPVLSTEDIIALLTTGSTLEELTGPSGAGGGSGDLAASYFAGAITDPLSRQMEQLLKLEKIEINPVLIRGEADPTTRVTVGERVGDDVNITLSTDIGGNTERYYYEVEWRATKRVALAAEQDTSSGLGGGVRYFDKFWWHRPETRREVAVPAGVPGAPSVAADGGRVLAVTIEGVPPEEQRELLKRVPLAPDRSFSRSAMFRGVEAIRWYYVKHDRIEATVDAQAQEGPQGINLVYRVAPGPTTEVHIEGLQRKEERKLRAALQSAWAESVYNDDLYTDSIDLTRDFFQQRGFYAVDVQLAASAPSANHRRIDLRVDPGRPVRVEAVHLHGAVALPAERIRQQMLTRPTSLFARKLLIPRVLTDDLAAIRSLYRDQGYLDVRVDPPRIRLAASGEQAVIDIHVSEGARYTIAAVGFPEGLAFSADQLREWTGLAVGEPFSRRELLATESRLRSRLDQAGYPDARVRGRIGVENGEVRIEFEVDPGMSRRIAEIVIQGNTLTQDRVIRREIDVKEGDSISRESLLRIQHRLYRLGIFRSVNLQYLPVDAQDPTWQRLEVTVVEAEPFATALGLGYDAEAGARVDFSLSHQNVGGYNRSASVQGRFDDLERRLQLVAKDPRLFAHRLPGLGTVSWSERNEPGFDERRRAIALRVDRRFGPAWSAFARYGLDRVDLSNVEDEVAVLEERLENIRLGDLSGALIRSTLDNPFLPTKGSRLNLGVAWFGEALLSEATFVKSSVAWTGYRRLASGIGLVSSARLSAALPFGATERVPLSERFFAGGASTVRGFERDELGPTTDSGTPTGGQALLIFNEEFRFPIWRSLRGVLFYDAGNVFDEVADVDLIELRHVLGAGLHLETPVGPLRLEYGRKLDREPGETSGEWFLSIGAAF